MFERHSEGFVGDVGVNFSRRNAGMTQQSLNKPDIQLPVLLEVSPPYA
jgi:hypothetical protein